LKFENNQLNYLVDSDTGTENWRNSLKIALLGNMGNMGGFGNAVLLEGTIDGVAR